MPRLACSYTLTFRTRASSTNLLIPRFSSLAVCPLPRWPSLLLDDAMQACGLGLADAVVDLVETGTTMRAAGLCILENLMTTEAVLIQNPQCKHPDLAEKIIARIQGYIDSTKFQLINYNSPRSCLEKCLAITPGKKSPSILPLERGDWVAVQAMISRKEVAEIIDRLVAAGAEDILVFALSNCRV